MSNRRDQKCPGSRHLSQLCLSPSEEVRKQNFSCTSWTVGAGTPQGWKSLGGAGDIGRRLHGEEVPGGRAGALPLSCWCLLGPLQAPAVHSALPGSAQGAEMSSTPKTSTSSQLRSHQLWKDVRGHLQGEADSHQRSCSGALGRHELVPVSLRMLPIQRQKGEGAASGTSRSQRTVSPLPQAGAQSLTLPQPMAQGPG